MSLDYAIGRSPLANPRVIKSEGVCGGNARISGTRIPVWGLVAPHLRGCPDERLIEIYPQLSMEDLRAAWQYYDNHQDEIHKQIADNAEA